MPDDIYTSIADGLRRRLSNRVNNEIELQEAVAQCLPIGTRREYHFTAKERIDFFIEASGIGVECKCKGSAQNITRQLLRYEPHCPGGLILVLTAARNIPRVCQKLEIVVPTFA